MTMVAATARLTSKGEVPRKKSDARAASAAPFSRFQPLSSFDGWLIQRKAICACGGDCPKCGDDALGRGVQSKLTVSTPGDAYEREADRIAEEVLRMPGLELNSHLPPRPQPHARARANQIGRTTDNSIPPAHSDDFSSRMQLASDLGVGEGNPLPRSVRAFFEPRFGRQLGHVRIHTTDRAHAAADALNAQAFTVGNAIVFGRGQFSPENYAGKRLLAHELTHVIQQRHSDSVPARATTPSETTSPTRIVIRSALPAPPSGVVWRQAICAANPYRASDQHLAIETYYSVLSGFSILPEYGVPVTAARQPGGYADMAEPYLGEMYEVMSRSDDLPGKQGQVDRYIEYANEPWGCGLMGDIPWRRGISLPPADVPYGNDVLLVRYATIPRQGVLIYIPRSRLRREFIRNWVHLYEHELQEMEAHQHRGALSLGPEDALIAYLIAVHSPALRAASRRASGEAARRITSAVARRLGSRLGPRLAGGAAAGAILAAYEVAHAAYRYSQGARVRSEGVEDLPEGAQALQGDFVTPPADIQALAARTIPPELVAVLSGDHVLQQFFWDIARLRLEHRDGHMSPEAMRRLSASLRNANPESLRRILPLLRSGGSDETIQQLAAVIEGASPAAAGSGQVPATPLPSGEASQPSTDANREGSPAGVLSAEHLRQFDAFPNLREFVSNLRGRTDQSQPLATPEALNFLLEHAAEFNTAQALARLREAAAGQQIPPPETLRQLIGTRAGVHPVDPHSRRRHAGTDEEHPRGQRLEGTRHGGNEISRAARPAHRSQARPAGHVPDPMIGRLRERLENANLMRLEVGNIRVIAPFFLGQATPGQDVHGTFYGRESEGTYTADVTLHDLGNGVYEVVSSSVVVTSDGRTADGSLLVGTRITP